CGADVKMASSASNALDIFEGDEEWRPDILISDIQMPGIDGYALMRRVRMIDADIPAIALTAHSRGEGRLRAPAAGFHMPVSKPLDPDELVAVVESLAKRIEDRR